jgi:hypothetical protein
LDLARLSPVISRIRSASDFLNQRCVILIRARAVDLLAHRPRLKHSLGCGNEIWTSFDRLAGDPAHTSGNSPRGCVPIHTSCSKTGLGAGERLRFTLLEMARDAHDMFGSEIRAEKRRLLNFVCSNSIWANGELHATLRQPFNLIAEMGVIASRAGAANARNLAERPEWLGRLDSNRNTPE